MDILQKILAWSLDRPLWQRDALRRLWTQGTLTKLDKSELYELLRSESGLPSCNGIPLAAKPLSGDDIPKPAHRNEPTLLLAVHSLKNVNALAECQRLEFGQLGLTIIYGDNSSGKSGYSRTLKRVCRARGSKERIHPNVFAQSAEGGAASASFDVLADGATSTLEWTENGPSPDALADLSVFDSTCARAHVDEANEVAYQPYGLEMLTQLADLCGDFKAELQHALTAPGPVSPLIQELTGEGKLIPALGPETHTVDIDRAAAFSDSDEARLRSLRAELRAQADRDPQTRAERLKRQRERLFDLRKALLTLKLKLRRVAIVELRRLQEEHAAALQAQELAATESFSREPLPGTGGAAWREMFEAARRFSESAAYSGREFPVAVGDDALCVLCQQALGEEAGARLQRFWRFVRNYTSQRANEVKLQLEQAAATYNPPMAILEDGDLMDQLERAVVGLTARVRDYRRTLFDGVESIRIAIKSCEWHQVSPVPFGPVGVLSAISRRIRREIEDLGSIDSLQPNTALANEIAILEERQRLALNRDLLVSHIGRLRQESALQNCIRSVDTEVITKKHKAIISIVVTEGLERAFGEELTFLGVGYLADRIRMRKLGEAGSTKHRFGVASQSATGIELAEILSEGEHRMVAIASFLAELGVSDRRSGIIFDDPVSSLDHLWRLKVAKRLAKESCARQVVVFTHDLFFMLAIQSEAEELGHTPKFGSVARLGNRVGLTSPELPIAASKTGQRVSSLQTRSAEARQAYEESDHPDYEHKVRRFYTQLRDAWERAVEEILFKDVVCRYRHDVQISKLKAMQVPEEDIKVVFDAWTKCCTYAHDPSRAEALPLPAPDELKHDLEKLERLNRTHKARKQTGQASA